MTRLLFISVCHRTHQDTISYSFISVVQKSEFQDIRTGIRGNRRLESGDWIRGNTTTKVGPPTTLTLPPHHHHQDSAWTRVYKLWPKSVAYLLWLWTDVRTLLRKWAVLRVEPVIFADRFSWGHLSQLRIVLQCCTFRSSICHSSVSRLPSAVVFNTLFVFYTHPSSARHPSVFYPSSVSSSSPLVFDITCWGSHNDTSWRHHLPNLRAVQRAVAWWLEEENFIPFISEFGFDKISYWYLS